MTDATPGIAGTYGDLAPGLVHYTDDVLFGEVGERPGLTKTQRSLVTVTALIAGGNSEQPVFHLAFARKNGNSQEELIEAITHAAFYVGWPKAMSALAVAKKVFADADSNGADASSADASSSNANGEQN